MSVARMFALLGLLGIAFSVPAAARGQPPVPYFAKYHGGLPKAWGDLAFAIKTAWFQDRLGDLQREVVLPGEFDAAGESRRTVAFKVLEEIIGGYDNGDHPSQWRAWPIVEQWHEMFPDSANPKIVKAMMLIRYALFAPEEPDEAIFPPPGYRPRQSALNEAEELLEGIDRSVRPAYWVAESLKLKIAQGVSAAELFTFVDEWAQTFPDNIEPKLILIDHVIDDLHWGPENIQAMVRSLADNGKGDVEVLTYTRIYLHTFESKYGSTRFRASLGKWPYVRAGLKKIAEKWPSPWVQNHRAAAACLAGDFPVAKAAFAMLGGPPETNIWRIPKFYEDCRDWVSNKGIE